MHDGQAKSGNIRLIGFIDLAFSSEDETLNSFGNTIFIVAGNYGMGRILGLSHAICHGNAQPNFLNHGGIVAAITYCHDGLKGTWQASPCVRLDICYQTLSPHNFCYEQH